MANVSRVNGFKPVMHMNGSPWNGQLRLYEVAVGNATPVYVGDAVVLSTDVPTGGTPAVQSLSGSASAANDVTSGLVIGVVEAVINVKQDPWDGKMTAGAIALDTPNASTRAASTKQYVLVSDASDTIYEVQSTASFALADVGLNADVGVLAVSGNQSVTGQSGMYINATAANASATRPVQVLGFAKRPDNEVASAYNKLLVRFTTYGYGNAIVGV